MLVSDEVVEIAVVADNPGDWLLHCHMLEHTAAGMLTWLKVLWVKITFKRATTITGFLGLAMIIIAMVALTYASLGRREYERITSVGA